MTDHLIIQGKEIGNFWLITLLDFYISIQVHRHLHHNCNPNNIIIICIPL